VFDDLEQFPELSGVVAIIVGHAEFRLQPELCFHIVFFNVNVERFARRSFIGTEEKSEAAMLKDDRHGYHFNKFDANSSPSKRKTISVRFGRISFRRACGL
jgi:hypothetical protein